MPSSLLLKESTGHDTTTSFSISALNRDGTCSAFSPYKPTTVLTNLQRGNVQTQTPSVLPERSLHQLAAQGELFLQNLDDNFNVNLQDENGFTPLMWASSYGQLETVRKLILRGALVSVVGSSGENALILASASGHAAIVRELINFGASLNYKDQEGNTALMYAAYNNHSGCTQELLNAGADLTAMNETFDSAYDIAVKRRSKNAQAVMEKYMLSIMSEAKMKQ
ncbi:ankyrin repeat family A protein 2-like isoform X1 [Stegodyphus dumicola]|uniref:ankyrin repeat family A protein 2-like isoform X1 n=1 Tax=Stegodyphus dumicola TaxID=202533 RepID=UPI0015B001FE|nr:ankyrin repeat family A protein 2-like isoform X1 [Stegodyphus dumicola]